MRRMHGKTGVALVIVFSLTLVSCEGDQVGPEIDVKIVDPKGSGGEADGSSVLSPGISDTLNKSNFSIGTYLVCEQWQGYCDYKKGIERIKSFGGSVVLVSVGGGDGTLLYSSKYLPKTDWVNDNNLKDIVDYAHSQQFKVYAWLSTPHGYWLKKYPDWISVSGDGKSSLYKHVPPIRILTSAEWLTQMKGILTELAGLGFDGVDWNDDFQYDWDASYDSFSLQVFQKDTGLVVSGNTPKERADFIKKDSNILAAWYAWKAKQITDLLGKMQGFIKEAGSDIPLRPHLMHHLLGYEWWGYDFKAIARGVDMPYIMFGFDKENIKAIVATLKGGGATRVAASLYLDQLKGGGAKVLGEGLQAAKDAGAEEVFLFNYMYADQNNLWPTVIQAVNQMK